MVRVGLYARYSSALQDARSVEDQLRDGRARAAAEGWEIVDTFADYAISGAVRDRPGLNALVAAIEAGRIDLVLAEALDRISRDQEDIAHLYKRIRFAGARLLTLSEGEIGEIHIGFKGTMAALFRRDLAEKVKRGLRGRVAAGRHPAGIAYGYRKVIRLGPGGEPERGLREIDAAQAEVVRRIVRDYLAGLSPLAIARALNAEGVPSPRGGRWSVALINGDAKRGNGILHNALYAGRLVYNRTSKQLDPVTRRTVIRVNPREAWIVRDCPELRIVDEADWQALRQHMDSTAQLPAERQRRPKRLLSGLLRCGVCGGDYIVADRRFWGCGAQMRGGDCRNGRRLPDAGLDARVLSALKDRLLDPEAVAMFVREYSRASAESTRQRARDQARQQRAADEARARVRRLVTAIATTDGDIPELAAALREAKAQQQAAEAALGKGDGGQVLALHPNLAEVYRQRVAALDDWLLGATTAPAVAHQLRALIDAVIVTPTSSKPRTGLTLTVTGRLTTLMQATTQSARRIKG